MGARISVQFEQGKEKSVVLFSHWGGEEFLRGAKLYVKELKLKQSKKDKGMSTPLTRFEPQTVMVDFVRDITKNMEEVDSDLYFGFNENDGDNSDYGHHIIKLPK